MMEDREMFERLRAGANPVHPARLEALRRGGKRQVRRPLLPTLGLVAVTVLVVGAGLALSLPDGGGNVRLGSGWITEAGFDPVPKGRAQISISCADDPVVVSVANGSDRSVILYAVEAYDENDPFGPERGQVIERVNTTVGPGATYTHRLPATFLRGDPTQRMVGVHSSFTSYGHTCAMGPGAETFVVPTDALPASAPGPTSIADHAGADATSPWGIPREFLRSFQLENEGSGVPMPGSALLNHVEEYGGKQLLQNEWISKPLDRARPPAAAERDGVFFVADVRWRFGSAQQADEYHSGVLAALGEDLGKSILDFHRVDDTAGFEDSPNLGDRAMWYRGTTQAEDTAAQGGGRRVNAYAIRNGAVVSVVLVIGDETPEGADALRFARAAESRVRQTLAEGR